MFTTRPSETTRLSPTQSQIRIPQSCILMGVVVPQIHRRETRQNYTHTHTLTHTHPRIHTRMHMKIGECPVMLVVKDPPANAS